MSKEENVIPGKTHQTKRNKKRSCKYEPRERALNEKKNKHKAKNFYIKQKKISTVKQ